MNKKRKIKSISCSVIAAALLLSGVSLAEPPRSLTHRARIERALSAVEGLPDKDALLAIHPDAAAHLRRIVEQPNGKELARNRALTVLRLFPSDATRATLQAALARFGRATTPGVELMHAQQAVVSYAVVAKKAALAVVAPYLTHRNRDLRHAAALAVRLSGHPNAEKVLAHTLATEKTPMVRHQLQRQIAALKAAPKKAPAKVKPSN